MSLQEVNPISNGKCFQWNQSIMFCWYISSIEPVLLTTPRLATTSFSVTGTGREPPVLYTGVPSDVNDHVTGDTVAINSTLSELAVRLNVTGSVGVAWGNHKWKIFVSIKTSESQLSRSFNFPPVSRKPWTRRQHRVWLKAYVTV